MAKKEKKTGTKKTTTPEVVNSNEIIDKSTPLKKTTKKDKKNKTEKKLLNKKDATPKKVKTPKAKKAAPENKTIKPKDREVKISKANIVKQDPLTVVSNFLGSIKGKHLSEILHDLMTEKEIKEFAERIEILKQLQNGVTQRVIAKNLGISVTTVSRGSKVLQTGKQRIKKYL